MAMMMMMTFVVPFAAGFLSPFVLGVIGVEVASGVAPAGKRKRSRLKAADSEKYKARILHLISQDSDTLTKMNEKFDFPDMPASKENHEKRKGRIKNLLAALEGEGKIEKDGTFMNATRWSLTSEGSSCA